MPLVKLGYLFIRTIAKPIANVIKQQAKERPAFRSACARLAQYLNRTEVRWRRRVITTRADGSAGAGAEEARIKPLDENKAIELGANFIGEAIVFAVAGAVLIADSSRSHHNETVRRRAIESKFEQLFSDMSALTAKHDELQARFDLLTVRLDNGSQPSTSPA